MLWLLIVPLVSVLLGFFVWLRSDMPLIHREIALNTRKGGNDENPGSAYKTARLLSGFYKVCAVLIWITGVVLTVAMAIVRAEFL